MSSKYRVVFILGPPGCGKGTQCIKISKEFGFPHLSAGDLLRAERDRAGSTYGELIETHIRNGSIVPVEITCKLLENAMADAGGGAPGFLIDGFPRNEDNLKGWEREMGDKTELMFVLAMECPQELCVKRCLGRNQGRSDDNEESLKKRVGTYENQTLPIIQHYEKSHKVRKIDASKSVEEVFAEIRRLFDEASKKRD